MRLIDADELLSEFLRIALTRSLTNKKDRMTFARIKEIIDKQPTVKEGENDN